MARYGVGARLVLVVVAVGCKHEAGPEYFGHQVAPPHGLDVLRPGMTLAQAHTALPSMGERGQVPSGVDDVQLTVGLSRDVVTEISATYQKGLAHLLAQAWGPPRADRGQGNGDEVWEDASTGWRAELVGPRVRFFRTVTPELFGEPAHPFGALKSLTPSSTATEARALLPLAEDVTAGPLKVLFVENDDVLEAIVTHLTPQAKTALITAWTPGTLAENTGAETPVERAWFAPDDGWRAFLRKDGDDYALDISPMLPVAQLLGPGHDIAALPTPLLGMSFDDVARAYPKVHRDDEHDASIPLRPDEWNEHHTMVVVSLTDAKVAMISIPLRYAPHPEFRDELLKLFASKWGEGKEDSTQDAVLTRHGGKLFAYPPTAAFLPVVEDPGNGELFLELRRSSLTTN